MKNNFNFRRIEFIRGYIEKYNKKKLSKELNEKRINNSKFSKYRIK
jgi:hypothetical protein